MAYCGDHVTRHTNVKPLSCTPETDTVCQLDTSIKKESMGMDQDRNVSSKMVNGGCVTMVG